MIGAASPRGLAQKIIGQKCRDAGKRRYPARVVGGGVAEDLFERGLCLPSGTAMTAGELERVVGVIRRCGEL